MREVQARPAPQPWPTPTIEPQAAAARPTQKKIAEQPISRAEVWAFSYRCIM